MPKLAGPQAPTETEVWVRNPKIYIRECAEVFQRKIVWEKGYLVKARTDPDAFMRVHFGQQPWTILVIDYDDAIERTHEGETLGSWPVWSYDDHEHDALVPLIEDANTSGGRVVLTHLPDLRELQGQKFLSGIAGLQRANPRARLHLNGVSSFRWTFGSGIYSGDTNPRLLAQKGRISLPNGSVVDFEDAPKEWIQLLGYTHKDLEIPRNRCMYNIVSARWAGENFRKNANIKMRGFDRVDPLNPKPVRKKQGRHLLRVREAQDGDYFFCGRCSLASDCRYYREGSVCSVPGSKGSELAKKFESRDAGQIIEGMGEMIAKQAERLEKQMDKEEENEYFDPNVTKLFESTMKYGAELAKMLDPTIGKLSEVPSPTGTVGDNALLSRAVKELEAEGLEPKMITEELAQLTMFLIERGAKAPAKEAITTINARQLPAAP